ncbi:MAG: elongation factor G [bacterium]
MKNVDVSAVRTFAIMGHTGSGKTSIVDSILFKLGLNDRLGSVSAGSSMADYSDAEKHRKITLQAKPFSVPFTTQAGLKCEFVFCDTPGYMDFYGQVIAASSVCESALITVDAHSGIQLGTKKAWARIQELGMPAALVVTGLDRENADFNSAVEKIRQALGGKCLPVTLPLPGAKSVIDVLAGKSVPADQAAAVDAARNALSELAAETDDALLEKFLGGTPLSADELETGIRKAVISCKLVPVFACVPVKDVGVSEMLEGIVRLMPSPIDRKYKDAEGKEIDPAPSAPLAGFVWRTVSDPHVGQLVYVRICGGTLKADSDVLNGTRGEKERIVGILCTNGKAQSTVELATAGDIIALAKLKHTKLNDALCTPSHKVAFKPLVFPNPVMSYAVRAKSRADEDKMSTALARVAEDDPTLKVRRDTETHETLLSGMGDVHLDVAVEQMKIRSNVEVLLDTPKVPYRETVTGNGEGHYKHKKQSGGRGQYGEVYLRVSHRKDGDEEWFVNDIFGGAIPTNFIPAVQKGLVEGLAKGPLAGYPVSNVKISVYDGTFHEVDSSEIAFKIASSRAFRAGMANAKPVLLEPIMTVRVTVPDQCMGDVTGDISHKRGRMLGMEQDSGHQIIVAEMPQSEMFKYAAELRSMTSGQGTFEMSFSRYDVVPGNVSQKIIAAAAKDIVKEEE